MPQQNQFDIFRRQLGCDGIQVGIGTMQNDDIRLLFVDDFLQVVIIGKSNILAGDVHGRCDAVDFDTIDCIYSGNTVLAKAYDDILEGFQAFAHVFGNGLYAAFNRIIIFCNLEYSFLHSRFVSMIFINTFADFSHENRVTFSKPF